MKFKAKPIKVEMPTSYDWDIPVDSKGYVTGYYVDGFIVGEVIESTEEYINLSWWYPVDVGTLEVVKERTNETQRNN